MAATLTKKQYLRREVMWAAFRVFDTNGDGVITKDELARILKAGVSRRFGRRAGEKWLV